MTTPTLAVTVQCQCYPPIRRDVPATGDPRVMRQALLMSCRRRGCRCEPCEVVGTEPPERAAWRWEAPR